MTKRHYKKKKLPIGKTKKETEPSQKLVTTEVTDRDAKGRPISIRQRVIAECVLDAYYIRELIATPQYDAGMRLRKAYLRAVLGIRVEDYGAGTHGDSEMGALMIIESERLL